MYKEYFLSEHTANSLSDNFSLSFAVGTIITLTQPTQPTKHTHSAIAMDTDRDNFQTQYRTFKINNQQKYSVPFFLLYDKFVSWTVFIGAALQ